MRISHQPLTDTLHRSQTCRHTRQRQNRNPVALGHGGQTINMQLIVNHILGRATGIELAYRGSAARGVGRIGALQLLGRVLIRRTLICVELV
jgi:hypothetical protein